MKQEQEYLTYSEKQKIKRYALYINGKLHSETTCRDHHNFKLSLYKHPTDRVSDRVFTLNQGTNLYN